MPVPMSMLQSSSPGSLTLLLSAQAPLPNKVSCFVSTCISSGNLFPRVRQEPILGPWKGSSFLPQYCLWNKICILWQEKKNLDIEHFLYPLASSLPFTAHCVCVHFASAKPPHWQKYLLNHKQQHSPSICCSHTFWETNSLRRTMQIVECSLLHQRAQSRVSS